MGVGRILSLTLAEVSKHRRAFILYMILLAAASLVTDALNLFGGSGADIGYTIASVFAALIVTRTILMGEEGNKNLPFGPYLGNYLLITLLIVLVLIALLFVLALVPFAIVGGMFRYQAYEGNIGLWVPVGLVAIVGLPVLTYVGARLSYCLPGVALRQKPYGFAEGWRDSKGVVFPFILAGLTIGLVLMVPTLILSLSLDSVNFWLSSIALGIGVGIMSVIWPVMHTVVYREHTLSKQADDQGV